MCVNLGSSSFSASGDVVAIRKVASLADPVATYILILLICIPIAIISALPIIYVAILACGDCIFKSDGVLHGGPPIIRRILRFVDFYALRHKVDEGFHPIKIKTALGGAVTAVALGAIICVSISLGIDYLYANVLTSISLLPAELPTLLLLSNTGMHSVESKDIPPILDGAVSRGFEVRVSSHGPQCGDPAFTSRALIAGNFSVRAMPTDRATASNEISFFCEDCAFGPLSSVSIVFPPACQTFRITALTIGATGSISISTVTVSAKQDISTTDSFLETVSIVLQPQLEYVTDTTVIPPTHQRGYIIALTSVDKVMSTDPEATTLDIDLAVSSTYSHLRFVPIRTVTQLLSAIVGLTGLIGGFGFAFIFFEHLCHGSLKKALAKHNSTRLAHPSPREQYTGSINVVVHTLCTIHCSFLTSLFLQAP